MFKLHVLDVTEILLWKVSGFLVSKQSTFLTYFQSSKYTEAKHSHIMHVRNNLKYFSIMQLCTMWMLNQSERLWKWTKQTQKWVSLEDNNYRYYSNNSIPRLMWTRTKNTHMNIWEKRLNHTILHHYCQRSFTSLFVNWRYDLGKKVPYYCLVQIWLKESAHHKKKKS